MRGGRCSSSGRRRERGKRPWRRDPNLLNVLHMPLRTRLIHPPALCRPRSLVQSSGQSPGRFRRGPVQFKKREARVASQVVRFVRLTAAIQMARGFESNRRDRQRRPQHHRRRSRPGEHLQRHPRGRLVDDQLQRLKDLGKTAVLSDVLIPVGIVLRLRLEKLLRRLRLVAQILALSHRRREHRR